MFRPAALAAALIIATATPAAARSDSQVWTVGAVNVDLGGGWRLSEELIGRFSDNRDGLYEIESTTLLSTKLNKNVTVAGGYVFNPQYSNGDRTATEHRLREQVTFDNVAEIGTGKLSARVRAEQRWRENVDGTGWRLRPYVKFAQPVGGKLTLNLTHESFINLNRTSFQSRKGYDRMRNLVSLSLPFSKKVSGEAGYLNQYGIVRGGPDNMDHVAYLGMSVSL